MPKLEKITVVAEYDDKEMTFVIHKPFITTFAVSQTMNMPSSIQIDASALGGVSVDTRKFDE